MKEVQSISILQCRGTECTPKQDVVVRECGLHIVLADSKGEQDFAFTRTVLNDPASLIMGLLYTTRIIGGAADVLQISVTNQLARVRLKDACALREKLASVHPAARIVTGVCGPDEGTLKAWRACDLPSVESSLQVTPSAVTHAVRQLNQEMPVFRQTGGTHGAALASREGTLLVVAEDVGRHNAVDRVIGAALQKGIDCSASLLVCTGRLTSDLVLKAAVARIPILASMGATVDSGIELAKTTGVTLVGFVRGSRMNIYTHSARITGAAT